MEKEKILSVIKEKNLSDYYPIFLTSNLIIEEQEEGYLLVKENIVPVKINNTSHFILTNCDGKTSITDLVNRLYDKYDSDIDTLRDDAIFVIYKLYRTNLIRWRKAESLFADLYRTEFKQSQLVGTLIINDVYKIVEGKLGAAAVSAYDQKPASYNKTSFMRRWESKNEYVYSLSSGDKTVCLLSIKPIYACNPVYVYLSFELAYFYLDNEWADTQNANWFDEFISWCINIHFEDLDLPNSADKQLIEFYVMQNDDFYEDYIENLKKFKFNIAGTLHNVNGSQHLDTYQKLIEL